MQCERCSEAARKVMDQGSHMGGADADKTSEICQMRGVSFSMIPTQRSTRASWLRRLGSDRGGDQEDGMPIINTYNRDHSMLPEEQNQPG
jgi:hypothetical protein